MIKPLADRVVVKPQEQEEVSAGGIIIPSIAQDKTTRGEILAAGGGVDGTPLTVKKGDSVIYSKHAGTEIEVDGDPVLIMHERDIFAIL